MLGFRVRAGSHVAVNINVPRRMLVFMLAIPKGAEELVLTSQLFWLPLLLYRCEPSNFRPWAFHINPLI